VPPGIPRLGPPHQIVHTPNQAIFLYADNTGNQWRVIPLDGRPHGTDPEVAATYNGDSVGHWEGDTLVVDTTNFNDKTRFRGATEDLHVVERFTRVDNKTLLYRFTVEDPNTWDKPWTGEYTWPATDKPIYEYACHEGNYALGDILRGARLAERSAENQK